MTTYSEVSWVWTVLTSHSGAVGCSRWHNGAVLAKVLPTAAATTTWVSMAGDQPNEGNHDEERFHDENWKYFGLTLN